jgi:penicillin G amidase
MKILKWGMVILFALVSITLLTVFIYLKSTLPEYDGHKIVSGIQDEVEIIRDSFGMPHIYAGSDQDAYFALGFCQAQDRLFQMDLARRTGQGRLSEILGTPLIKVDKLFRTLNAALPSKKWKEEMTPESLNSLKAFSAGVNHFLKTNESPLPIEFTILGYAPDPWTLYDSMAVMLYMGWSQNYAFKTELLHAAIVRHVGKEMARELFIDYPSGFPAIIPEDEDPIATVGPEYLKTLQLAGEIIGFGNGGASNSWVVSSKKSKTGKPLFANDPHLSLNMPSIWYEAHIATPSMNISGALVAGLPFITAGANEHIAWGVTNSHYDDADFYIEKIHPDNPSLYQYRDKWEEMKIRKESIAVNNADMVNFNIRLTRHGPVIDSLSKHENQKGFALAMRWAQADFPKVLKGFWLVNHAGNIRDIEHAAGYAKSGQNWIYADDKGNIGFYFLGGIPIRKNSNGELPVPGWTGEYEWEGYAADKEQPHLRNPKKGYIVNANNKVEPEGYPYVITTYYATPDRFVRIQEMLEEKGALDSKDFENMLSDIYMVMARDWTPLIIAALKDVRLSKIDLEALNTLKKWDFKARHNQAAPAVFNVFMNYIAENTFKKRLGDDLYEQYVTGDKNIPFNVLREFIQQGESPWFDDPDTPEKEGMNHILVKSFKDSTAFLKNTLGSDTKKWTWGKIHTLTIYHPLGKKLPLVGKYFNIGPVPVDGSIFTVNPTYFKLTQSYKVKGGGASLRHIIDFSDMKNSKRILPGGVSGNVMSPHYDDQFNLWLAGKYRPFVLDREDVMKDERYRYVMSPEKEGIKNK